MGIEQRATLPGEEGAADARRAITIMERVLDVLEALDRVHHDDGQTTWAITHLTRSSVATGLVVGSPRRGITVDQAEDDLRLLVDGFAAAEDHEGLPVGWNTSAARAGADLGHLLGATSRLGMVLGLVERRAHRRPYEPGPDTIDGL